MTANQYRVALSQLGFTQLQAGELLGYALRTSNAYASGELDVPKPIAIVLRALVIGKITMEDLK